jgi:hypothetical protein
MKVVFGKLLLVCLLAGSLVGGTFVQTSDTSDQGAKQDAKDAASSTKQATKKTAHKVKKTTKKGVHKGAKKARQGAEHVEDSTRH